MLAGIRESWRTWVRAQSLDLHLEGGVTVEAWIGTTVAVLAIIGAAAALPVVDELFELHPLPAIGFYIPAAIVGVAGALRLRHNKTIDGTLIALELVGSALLQLFCVSLIVYSSPIGAAVFCSLLMFTAGYHGHFLRVTLSEPFLAIGTALAVLIGIAIVNTPQHQSILVVAGGAAFTVELLAGTTTRRADLVRKQSENLRAALNAQMISEQDGKVRLLSETLVDLMGASHDLNNALATVRVAADHLEVWSQPEAEIDKQDVADIGSELSAALGFMTTLVADMRDQGVGMVARDSEPVAVLAVVEETCHALHTRFPRTAIVCDSSVPAQVRVNLRGGAPTLRRIIENLLTNACEGDGQRGANHITLSAKRDDSGGRVEIAVRDDGPGFDPSELAKEIEGFSTRKANGTGLGLYTCERLVRASGGSIVRANNPSGGATVTILLPLGAS